MPLRSVGALALSTTFALGLLGACSDAANAPLGAGGSASNAAGASAAGGENGGAGGGAAGVTQGGSSSEMAGTAGMLGESGSASGGAAAGHGGSGGVGGGAPGVRDFSANRDLFFGASRCATADVAFCEDFESGALAAGTWKTGGTAPVIDELQAARGKKALHVTKAGKGNATLRTDKPFPAMNGRYWGRAFVYLNAMPHNSAAADSLTYSHWTIIAATGAVVAGEVRIGGQLQKRFQNPAPLNFWGVGTDNRNQAEGSGDWTNADNDPPGAPKPVTEKEWSCVEWMGDYMTDETQFFLDATEHPSLATTPTTAHKGNPDKPFLLPEFNAIWFGWAEYQDTTQSFELWFDEIAIDHERIGCVL